MDAEPVNEGENEPEDICCICLNSNVEFTKILCGHQFCSPCIEKYLYINPKCPLCRKEITRSHKINLHIKFCLENYYMNNHYNRLKNTKLIYGILFISYQIYELYILNKINNSINILSNILVLIDILYILCNLRFDFNDEKHLKIYAKKDIDFLKTDNKCESESESENCEFSTTMIVFLKITFKIFWYQISLMFIERSNFLKWLRWIYYYGSFLHSILSILHLIVNFFNFEKLNKIYN